MPLDPTTPTNNDHHYEEPIHPDAERRTGSRDPVDEAGEEPIRTLLWTAATYRPLEEVAALVMLLKRTGEVPNPGDEALRVAAVARPIDEVMQLVAMLNEPPHEIDEADTTLRAAAVGRPIEEVAQLVSFLGTHENEPPFATAHRDAARGKPAPTLFGRRGEQDRRDAYAGPPERDERDDRADLDSLDDHAAHAARAAEPQPAPQHVAPWTSAPAGPPPEVPRLAPAAGGRSGAGPRNRRTDSKNRGTESTESFTLRSSVRSPLRWPAAAALFACGAIHLPTDFAGLRSGGYADAVSLVVTLLCLVFGVWLAVADSARIWAAGAATAVGIIAAHALSGLGTVDLLRSSLGADFGWASPVAVGCAAIALVLSGIALTLRQKAVQKAIQQGLRRPARSAGIANDA
ncbi:hypothetical protein [Streptomyces sp. NPDC006645]|uniref:hypothetical protein n=1 Tax=unclassified Streptomyces TaxID=2593676 RepID=UPI0033BA7E51